MDISLGEYPDEPSINFKEEIHRKRPSYTNFIEQKLSKKLVDPYSAFQPFNESSRAFYPFIKKLKDEVLKPDDVILDTWCRTGWSTFFLAAMFPEQEVISIWEGDKDVLGYQGFDYWFSPERKPSNARIIFTNINKKLPLKSRSIKLVYGLDTLHRYDQSTLVPELFRVVKTDGVVVFPHIHLTNSSPDPFFERGEKQLHGTDYERYFKSFLMDKEMEAYVNSEPRMFALDKPEILKNDPNTKDYNAIIAAIPKKLGGFELEPYQLEFQNILNQFILTNPYLDINLNNGIVKLDKDYLNGVVGEMLDRHPIYHKKIKSAHNFQLSDIQTKILYLANHNYSNKEIVELIKIEEDEFVSEILELASIEIIHVLPLSRDAKNLQAFHSAKKTTNIEEHTLQNLRSNADPRWNSHVIINDIDESELSRNDTIYLINQIQGRLAAAGMKAGDNIAISSKPHFEALLVFWAAVEIGVEVCILNTELPSKAKCELLEELMPILIYVDSNTYLELSNQFVDNVIFFDDERFDGKKSDSFSHWMEGETSESEISNYQVSSDSNAAILYTSGTTGKPKGIRLSHGALYRSGQLFSEIYGWTHEDRLIMVTELDSMSGLRNVAVATQFSGTTVVVTDFNENNQVFSIIEAIRKNKVTLLSATPALINQLVQLGEKIRGDLKSLRQVICTGGKLTKKLASDFEKCYGLRIYNYYGLTETTGLCIGEYPGTAYSEYGSIGVSIDSATQIVDDNDQILDFDEVGRLRIFNDRLMTGYFNDQDQSNLQIKNGWLYTGDLATQDKNGFFFLKAREREIVKDPTGNITYLSEVEDCILSHEEVEDVVVCPIDHHEIEQLVAFIILKSDHNSDLKDNLRVHVSNQLGKWKSPMFMEFIAKFPVNSRGKIDKKALVGKLQAAN
ncbi:AMP-binding protein [Ekhidna sp. To15]|uniref:AMP-binding protein n=1 Tax=Ekhidna sp. To15 TaxID=3395267 RepID=UPI003F523CAE